MKATLFPHLSIIAIAILTALAPLAVAQDAAPNPQIDLRPKVRAGQVSRYEVWTLRRTHETMRGNGQERSADSSLEVTGQVTWRVDRVDTDGSSVCTMTTDWMVAKLTAPTGKVYVNDSRLGSGDNEMLQKLVQAVAGSPIRVEVGADGSIRSASGAEAIQQKLGDEIPAPEDDDFAESASDLATIPGALAQAVVGGAGWRHDLKIPHQMGMITAPVNYQLNSVEQIAGVRVANVSGAAKLSFEPKLPEIPAGGPQVTLRMIEGDYSTQVMFDLWRNEAVGRNTIQSQTLELTLSIQGQTMSRTMQETTQGQALRISEE